MHQTGVCNLHTGTQLWPSEAHPVHFVDLPGSATNKQTNKQVRGEEKGESKVGETYVLTSQPAAHNLTREGPVPLGDLLVHQRDLARQLGLDHAQGAGPARTEGAGVRATADRGRYPRA